MILLCGIPSEPPLAMVRRELERAEVPHVMLNQRKAAQTRLAFEVRAGRVTGTLEVEGSSWPLESFDGVYTRLMDDRLLPELAGQAEESPARVHSRRLHETLSRWCEITPARVVNRAEPMGSNASKPFQAQLIVRHGFLVPETLVTNDPALVHSFAAEQGDLVYKSVSGVRSIVRRLTEHDLGRLGDISWCPVQFQQLVVGRDVRVHTVGGEVFATAVASTAVDYRYAHRDGAAAELEAVDLEPDVARRSLDLAAALGLEFAGIDLRETPDGRFYCFEVNPSPAFSYYESHTGQPIARAVARHLCGMAPGPEQPD